MSDNEGRADQGQAAVLRVGRATGVARQEFAATALSDVLAYVAHLCDRLGLDPEQAFGAALERYREQCGKGPRVKQTLDAYDFLPRA